MKGKIKANECERASKEKKRGFLLMVDNSFITHLLNTHSSPAPLFTPEFQSKGGMISL